VGELIKVLKNEEFPADIVLVKSDKESGIVFVDTMNLDGEVSYYTYYKFLTLF
jgi:phospholipid-translocating ATPase